MADYKSSHTGQQIDEAVSAVGNKVDKITGKGLSTNDYTNADKNKLDSIDMSSKQDVINDLNEIRSGAQKGETAIQPGDNISSLTNDSGFITSSYHDESKQNTLVSGSNIKTINGESVLGNGDIEIGGNVDDVKVNGTSVVDSDKVAQVIVPTKTSDITNDSGYVTNSYHDNSKQDTLVSGSNIKTINGKNILGGGNIDITGSGSSSNPWQNKIISIMGDSISTYSGWIPVADGHNLAHVTYYPRSTFQDVTKTWWHSLITELEAKLGINESWSGSYVCNTSDSEIVSGGNNYGTKCAMASNTRIENLGANGTPDLILVYGGTNDIWSGASRMGETVPGTFDSTQNYEINPTTLLATNKWTSFADAFRDMLLKMMYYYPTSRIVVLFPFYADSSSAYSHAKLDGFIEVQRNICDYFGVNYIDLRACGINIGNNASGKNKDGISYILTQNVHPNYDGMKLMKDYIKAQLVSMFDTDRTASVVYTVTNTLTNATNSKAYIKGVSAGKPYTAEITGSNYANVKVLMGGDDITASVRTIDYSQNKSLINITSCTGNIVITTAAAKTYTITTNVTNGTYTGATSVTESGSAIVTISANNTYKLPLTVSVSGANHTYDYNTGVITLTNPTSNITITATCPAKIVYEISTNVTGGTVSGSTSIREGETDTLTITPSEGYRLPDTITVVNATYVYDNISGSITLSEPSGNVSITATCVESVTYTITSTITNGTATGNTTIPEDGQAVVTLIANEGYKLPDTITVNGATYEYTKETGIVNLSNPTGNITITASCVIATSYTITVNITNGSYDGDTSIPEGGSGEVILSAEQGYVLPKTITVTGATYTYNEVTGSVNLSNPTNNVTISATCVREVWYSSNYNANTLNASAGLQYAGFAYKDGVNDADGSQMNAVRFVLNTPGLITVGKCSADFKTIVDSEQINVTGNSGDVIILNTSKIYTLTNGEHFFVNAPNGDSCLFKYANRNLPATQGDLSFMTRVGTSGVAVGGNSSENLSVDFGLIGEVSSYDVTTTVSNGSYSGISSILKNGTGTITITPNANYKLPTSVIVENADSNYDSTTGVITISNPTDNVVVTAVCVLLNEYIITTNVEHGSYSGDISIRETRTAIVTVTAATGYTLPESITVTNANYEYNNTTGVINLSNPTSDVVIVVNCISAQTFTITTSVTNGTYSGATTIIEYGTAEVTLSSNSRFALPNTISVTGATYTYNKNTGLVQLSNPTGNVTISATCTALTVYTITTSVINGTYTGATDIAEGETKTITITPDTDCYLPETITVTGTENYTYNSENGVITLFNPTANIVITVECTDEPMITWYSSNYNANTVNVPANLSYAGFAYIDGVHDGDGLSMNQVRFVLHSPGLITVGKCSADFKTIVDSEQLNVTGSAGNVKEIELSKTYTLENGEHFFVNAPSGDTGLFKYCDRNVPATQGDRMFMVKVGTSGAARNAASESTALKECLSVDFGYKKKLTWHSENVNKSVNAEAKPPFAGFVNYLDRSGLTGKTLTKVRFKPYTAGVVTVGVVESDYKTESQIQQITITSDQVGIFTEYNINLVIGENQYPFIGSTTDVGTWYYSETGGDGFKAKVGQSSQVESAPGNLGVDFGYVE